MHPRIIPPWQDPALVLSRCSQHVNTGNVAVAGEAGPMRLPIQASCLAAPQRHSPKPAVRLDVILHVAENVHNLGVVTLCIW